MKNEAKMGLIGEHGGDELSCKHDCICDSIAIQSLKSKIALHFFISIWELIVKNYLFANAFKQNFQKIIQKFV